MSYKTLHDYLSICYQQQIQNCFLKILFLFYYANKRFLFNYTFIQIKIFGTFETNNRFENPENNSHSFNNFPSGYVLIQTHHRQHRERATTYFSSLCKKESSGRRIFYKYFKREKQIGFVRVNRMKKKEQYLQKKKGEKEKKLTGVSRQNRSFYLL